MKFALAFDFANIGRFDKITVTEIDVLPPEPDVGLFQNEIVGFSAVETATGKDIMKELDIDDIDEILELLYLAGAAEDLPLRPPRRF